MPHNVHSIVKSKIGLHSHEVGIGTKLVECEVYALLTFNTDCASH